VDDRATRRIGDQHLEASPFQAISVEVVFHREARPEKSDTAEASRLHGARTGVGHVEERHRDRSFDRIGHEVHRVGAEQDHLRSRHLQPTGVVAQPSAGGVPFTVLLQGLDLGEVVRSDEEVSGMGPSQSAADLFVDDPLVLGRRLPAHTPEQTDRPHCRPAA
jgi:hypothetical protein